MNIVEAMEYVKQGKEISLHGKVIKMNSNGNLMRTYYRDFKVKAEEMYTPSMEDMLSDDWELVTTEIPNGAVVRVHETDLVVHSGYRGRKYLIDTYNHNFNGAKGICCALLKMDKDKIIEEFGDLKNSGHQRTWKNFFERAK